MGKVIIRSKSQYDKGTYKTESNSQWGNLIIWDYQLNAVIKDMKAEGYIVFINDWKLNNNKWEEYLKRI